jgi:hypothetical protein
MIVDVTSEAARFLLGELPKCGGTQELGFSQALERKLNGL